MLRCPQGHALEAQSGGHDWACSGGAPNGSCARNALSHGPHEGVASHGCTACSYRLCDRCCVLSRLRCSVGATVLSDPAGLPQTPHGVPLHCLRNLVDQSLPGALGMKHMCNNAHPLVLQRDNHETDWLCDGSAEEGGCAAQDIRVVKRWRCAPCNFDMCDCCLMRRSRSRLWAQDTTPEHDEEEAGFLRDLEEEEDAEDADNTSCADTSPGSVELETRNPRAEVVYDPLFSVASALKEFDVQGGVGGRRGVPGLCKPAQRGTAEGGAGGAAGAWRQPGRGEAEGVQGVAAGGGPRSSVITTPIEPVAGLRAVFSPDTQAP